MAKSPVFAADRQEEWHSFPCFDPTSTFGWSGCQVPTCHEPPRPEGSSLSLPSHEAILGVKNRQPGIARGRMQGELPCSYEETIRLEPGAAHRPSFLYVLADPQSQR